MKRFLWSLPLIIAIPLLAVTPHFWEVRTYDDFKRGKLTNVSVTSDDELVLAPRFDMVFNTEQVLVWSAALDSKGNVYLGTGHDGKIYKVDSAGRGTLLADLAELDVLAVAVDSKDVVYAGTSPDGKVYRISADGNAEVFFDPDVKYIWSMVFDKQSRLMVATGDKGVIFRVSSDGSGETFYDTDETHVISMAVDKDGNIVAGGDPKGYIYRISPEGKAFVLYDSGMREVHSVAIGANGTIYAAVLGERPSFAPANTGASSTTVSGSSSSITVNVATAATPTQTGDSVDIIVTPDVSADTPRSSSTRTVNNADAQSVILEILPDGIVNTIWRGRDEMVYALLPRADRLFFSTGSKGRIYSMDGPRNTTLLVESTEDQTTSLIASGNRVYATSANIGKLFSMGDAPATSGSYESIVKDTEAISAFGKISIRAQNSDLIQVLTRTGNTSAPDRTWSDWAAADSTGIPASPKARFAQFKVDFKSDGNRAPSLSSLSIPYLQQNFRPEVTSLEVLPSGVSLVKVQAFNASGAPVTGSESANARASARTGIPAPPRIPPRRIAQKGSRSFQWSATDKNQDFLIYDLYYRGDGERTWKVLKRVVEDTFFTIDSDTIPDGTYTVRVVASDASSNPVESALTGDLESQPFVIDNTPPTVTLTLEATERSRVRVAIVTTDPTSTLNQAEISIDTGEWKPVFPGDGITDSNSESFSYLTPDLSQGEHVIAFRIYDENDNVGMGKLVVRIP